MDDVTALLLSTSGLGPGLIEFGPESLAGQVVSARADDEIAGFTAKCWVVEGSDAGASSELSTGDSYRTAVCFRDDGVLLSFSVAGENEGATITAASVTSSSDRDFEIPYPVE